MKKVFVLAILIILVAISIKTSNAQIYTNLNQAKVFFGQACASGLTPPQLRTAYDFNPLYSNGLNGSGKTVAIIVEQGATSLLSDLNAFDSQYGLPNIVNGTNFVISYPFGDPAFTSSSKNWTEETVLDVEVVHSMAPGAKIYLVVSPNDSWLFNTINYTINDLNVQTISISWGSSELLESSFLDQLNSIFYNAYRNGISVFVASGDTGAYNSQNSLNVNFPASSPYVVAVGGTALSINAGGGYLGESAWSGSGGGESSYFQRPSYQPDLSPNRMVPDVSFNAGTYICAYVSGNWGDYYGTSVAAPAWAALDSILNQKISGKSNQFEQSLYQAYYSSSSAVFHLISSGNNGYYDANGSYNMATGIGTPIAYQLVQALSKTAYTLHLNSNDQAAIFQINGINYSEGSTINLTAGQQVAMSVYAANNSGLRYKFDGYSGLFNSSSNAISFFINSSGSITATFILKYRLRMDGVGGNGTDIVWVNSSSEYTAFSPLYMNNSNQQYILAGIRFDNGPVINSQYYSYTVFAPANITFAWVTEPAIIIRLTGISNSSAAVSTEYLSYVPLSNQTWSIIRDATNNSFIYPLYNTPVNVTADTNITGAYRYAVQPQHYSYSNPLKIRFVKQSLLSISFYSGSGSQIIPYSFVAGLDGKNLTYYNSSIWTSPNSTLVIYSVNYSGFSVLSSPVYVPKGQYNTRIDLPVYNVNVGVYLDSLLPVPFTNVTLYVGTRRFSQLTNALGIAVFTAIPDSNYSVSVFAGGQNYAYFSQSGASLNIQIYPMVYQIYLAIAIIAVLLLGLAAFEIHRKHRIRRFPQKL